MSIATEISRIKDAKDAIRASIIAKGVNVPAAAKLDTYADRIDEIVQTASGNMEVVTSSPSGTINAADNKFYMLSGDAGALVFNLPAMQQGGHGIYLLMTTASTSVVSFTSTGSVPINFPTGFQVEADKCYLMDFEFAQNAWQVSVEEWFVNGGGSDQWESVCAKLYGDQIYGITEADIPSGITSIPEYMFQYRMRGNVTLPSSITFINKNAFAYDEMLTGFIAPEVTNIASYAFYNCQYLTNISVPKLQYISGDYTFSGCKFLKTIDLPLVKMIGNYAFYYCEKLKSIDAPLATSIGNNAFYSCLYLKEASFPSVTSIGASAFVPYYNNQRPGLHRIYIPSVTSIGQYAFQNGYAFVPTFEGTTPPSFGTQVFHGYNTPIFVPEESLDAYKNTTNLAQYANRIKPIGWTPSVEEGYKAELWFNSGTNATNDFKKIADDGTGILTKEEVNGTGQTVNNNLSTVILGNQVITVGAQAFFGINHIGYVYMPNVTTIESQAFMACGSMYQVDMPNVTTVGAQAFRNISIMHVNMPKVTSIGNNAFNSCSALESITFGSDLETIGTEGVFTYCSSMKEFDFSNTKITKLIGGSGATSNFYGCSSFTTLKLPATFTRCPWGTEYYSPIYNCSSVSELWLYSPVVPEWGSTQGNMFNGTKLETKDPEQASIYVLPELVDSYKAASGWKGYAAIIKPMPTE